MFHERASSPPVRFGHPFDRHDWFVDRGGREVRYVIDYYFNPDPKAGEVKVRRETDPFAGGRATRALHSICAQSSDVPLDPSEPRLTRAIHVDVRPAVDDATAVLDRLWRFPQRALESLRRPWFRAEGLDPAKAPKEAAALSMLHSSNTLNSQEAVDTSDPDEASERVWSAVDNKCKPLLEKLHEATTAAAGGAEASDDIRRLSVALRTCVGSVVCPDAASKFLRVMEDAEKAGRDAAGEEEATFAVLDACVAKRATERRDRRRMLQAKNATVDSHKGTTSSSETPSAVPVQLR